MRSSSPSMVSWYLSSGIALSSIAVSYFAWVRRLICASASSIASSVVFLLVGSHRERVMEIRAASSVSAVASTSSSVASDEHPVKEPRASIMASSRVVSFLFIRESSSSILWVSLPKKLPIKFLHYCTRKSSICQAFFNGTAAEKTLFSLCLIFWTDVFLCIISN